MVFFLGLLFLFIKRNCTVDFFMVLVVLGYSIINILADMYWGNNNFWVVGGGLLRILIPYLTLKIVGEQYWDYFVKIVVISALISIPFYALQLLYPQIFISLYPYFSWTDSEIRQNSGKYGFIIHVVHISYEIRNSGFAVEPGMFGYFLGMGIIVQLLKNELIIDRKILVLLAVGFTTVSTSFFLFAWVIISVLLLYRRNLLFYFINIPIILLIILYTLNLDFMFDKIIKTYDNATFTFDTGYQTTAAEGLNRIGGIILDLQDFFSYPLGYGSTIGDRFVRDGLMISSPNGLGRFIRSFGIVGILCLIVFIKRAGVYFSKNIQDRFISIIIAFSVFIFFFSNPLERDPILLMFLFSPMIFLKKRKN